METMTISELIESLKKMEEKHGDVPVVLFDWDTHQYFILTEKSIEAQLLKDGNKRLAIGIEDCFDQIESSEVERPI